jgi:AraC family transcriptional activator of tynA and feaB
MSTTVTWESGPDMDPGSSEDLVDAMARFVPIQVSPRRGTPRGEYFTGRELDDLVLIDVALGPRTVVRDPDNSHLAADEYFALASVHEGSEIMFSGSDTHQVAAGDVTLWRCDSPTMLEIPTFVRKSLILLPERVVHHISLSRRMSTSFEILSDSPVASLMNRMMGHMASLATVPHRTDRYLRNALLQMAIATIEGSGRIEHGGALNVLHQRTLTWIDDHLFDPDLSSEAIARAHAVSVRTLYRAFRGESRTLAEVIRLRKLERACDLLADPRYSITWVSDLLNFANPSHFSRAFSEHFGISPSDYRAQATTVKSR